MNATNKTCEGPLQGELQTTAQGNKRGHKQMEKYSMLMDRKNQYCGKGHIAQSNLDSLLSPLSYHRISSQNWKKLV